MGMKSSFLAGFTARILVVALLFFAFIVGGFVAGVGLHDPDTCWLLSLGRLIFETGGLPHTDPYSYTFAMGTEKPFVMYQWLAELFFYLSYRAGGLPGLLTLTTIILTFAFVSMPMFIARKSGTSTVLAVGLTFLMVLTACFHFLCRPEIFSYLLLSGWLTFVTFGLRAGSIGRSMGPLLFTAEGGVDTSASAAPAARQWKTVAILLGLMALWGNLHTGFQSAMIQFSIYVGCLLALGPFTGGLKERLWAPVLLVGSVLATCINPYGIGLWQYIPRLFFSPINSRIIELRPLSAADLSEPTYYPFFILIAIAIIVVARILKMPEMRRGPMLLETIASIVILATWSIVGITVRRVIPFGGIGIAFEVMFLLAQARLFAPGVAPNATPSQAALAAPNAPPSSEADAAASAEPSTVSSDPDSAGKPFLAQLDASLNSLIHPTTVMWFVTVAVFSAVGVFFISTRVAPPTIPQDSVAFHPPFKALKYLEKEPPPGRLLNDPQYGDVMIWHMKNPPKVFIDTRFDMYGAELVRDYENMTRCQGEWQALMSMYGISWVFLHVKEPLSEALSNDPGWRQLYKDEHSIVLAKRKTLQALKPDQLNDY